MRMKDLANMASWDKDEALGKLQAKAHGPANGQVDALDKKLSFFESKYHMKTQDMLRRFSEGHFNDDADHSQWLILAKLRAKARTTQP